jgi:alpha-mannosidase
VHERRINPDKNTMTKKLLATFWVIAAALWPGPLNSAQATENQRLWQIGLIDTNDAELALAPDGAEKFKSDGLFVVGQSLAREAWPYVHPGPADAWAGSRQHTFSVLFGLKAQPPEGECELHLALIDTHSQLPPKLSIQVNGRTFDRTLPRGNGDESIEGHPEKGRSQNVDVTFASKLLRAGDNEISITTTSGSWFLYDGLWLNVPAGAELAPAGTRTILVQVEAARGLLQKDGGLFQPVIVTLRHFGAEMNARARIEGGAPVSMRLASGETSIELQVPAVERASMRSLVLESDQGAVIASQSVSLKPVPKLTVYVLPHSHTDIGYTEIQTAVEKRQVDNLLRGIEAAHQTAANPPGARFVWNVEVLWAADLYMRRLSEAQKAEFLVAVKHGDVALNGSYLNELTGLCRPEELLQLFRAATRFSEQTEVTIDSVMISDVPGYTWGTVTAMAQAGIKYFSAAPNNFDRIGTILREWENKPFYWVGPDGKSKVLVWIPFWGYALSHRYGQLSPRLVGDLCDDLKKRAYPYDIAYVRWAGHGDNGAPDPEICEFTKDWNTKYAWPKFVISGTSEAFRAMEQRYGDKLPRVHGDWTPYWEDGAGSSALETSMNRANSDRLAQAEAVYAMLKRGGYSAEHFADAWRNVLLYSEHTWGADCSITAPQSQKTTEQWQIKHDYAQHADQQSHALLQDALAAGAGVTPAQAASVDVINTLSWPRTDVVILSPELSSAGDRVADARGSGVSSQRLTSGELAFLARDVPELAAGRFAVSAGSATASAVPAVAKGAVLENGLVRVRVDEKTGGIVELTAKGLDGNFVDTSGGESVNDYLYLPGDDLANIKHNGLVTVRVGEKGPLVASLIIESEAPGCTLLRREIRLVAGKDYVELINLVDKTRLQAASYHAKNGKESVNFAFPFNIPDGEMLLDIPFGVMNPETDQMPGACKNWFTVGRWLDVSNQQRGITWVTLDAPLVEIGGITANLLNSQTNPDVWRQRISRTQKFYSWVMNNHWGTNYRAYQEGPTVFRFILRPHRYSTPAENTRFATAFSYPLLPTPARGNSPRTTPFLHLDSPDVIVTTLKPSDDGKALVVRLFNTAGKNAGVNLGWSGAKPKSVWLSSTAETSVRKIEGPVSVPAWGVVTLRAELE